MSPLQTQYPLSPRKFWKKILPTIFTWVILFLAILGLGIFLKISLGDTPDGAMVQSLLGWILGPLFTFAAITTLLYVWYIKVYIRRYYYDAGDNFVTIKKGVFAPAEIHVMYQKIQDVYVDQDILDRIMGLYDVHLASATVSSGMEAHIDGLEHDAAEAIKNLLLSRIQTGGVVAAGSPVQSSTPQVPTVVTLNEDVSSKTYPLSGRWVAQGIVGSFFSSLFLSAVVSFYVFSPSKDSTASLGTVFGLSSSVWIWVFLIVFASHIVYIFLWRNTFSFAFLPEYIMMKSGIISRSEVHIPYRAVQDVTVKQGVIERLFGLATVRIENAAQAQMVGRKLTKSGVTIPGQTPAQANHIAEVTRSITLTKNTGQTGL